MLPMIAVAGKRNRRFNPLWSRAVAPLEPPTPEGADWVYVPGAGFQREDSAIASAPLLGYGYAAPFYGRGYGQPFYGGGYGAPFYGRGYGSPWGMRWGNPERYTGVAPTTKKWYPAVMVVQGKQVPPAMPPVVYVHADGTQANLIVSVNGRQTKVPVTVHDLSGSGKYLKALVSRPGTVRNNPLNPRARMSRALASSIQRRFPGARAWPVKSPTGTREKCAVVEDATGKGGYWLCCLDDDGPGTGKLGCIPIDITTPEDLDDYRPGRGGLRGNPPKPPTDYENCVATMCYDVPKDQAGACIAEYCAWLKSAELPKAGRARVRRRQQMLASTRRRAASVGHSHGNTGGACCGSCANGGACEGGCGAKCNCGKEGPSANPRRTVMLPSRPRKPGCWVKKKGGGTEYVVPCPVGAFR